MSESEKAYYGGSVEFFRNGDVVFNGLSRSRVKTLRGRWEALGRVEGGDVFDVRGLTPMVLQRVLSRVGPTEVTRGSGTLRRLWFPRLLEARVSRIKSVMPYEEYDAFVRAERLERGLLPMQEEEERRRKVVVTESYGRGL